MLIQRFWINIILKVRRDSKGRSLSDLLGDCETTIFYVKVIQKQQNNAGTLSLRSARSGTKFATSRSLSTDGRTYVFVSFESLNISFGSFTIAYYLIYVGKE